MLDQAFFAQGNVATAGGCLASSYLALWVIARTEGIDAAANAMHYVAPVGEERALRDTWQSATLSRSYKPKLASTSTRNRSDSPKNMSETRYGDVVVERSITKAFSRSWLVITPWLNLDRRVPS